ncbi:hypothetical protein GPECTOR_3g383 [Gonium pectorale]|uniref:Uncharacterized protein n=1 Tax=Gonium pectorale TaxID=33097 RepID=A0A150GZR3_GONPE|nr:hypothetical protein GPECTOR_3g383 [Gonium pectorale]|eukprot:KXZ55243.1 hypothetical protein GPECTOR_3g383 [Gonium pectorale]
MTAENWDLRAFIFGCDDLDDEEKKLCYDALNREGFSAANKRRAFCALDEADLRSLGVTGLSTRKVLLLAITASAAGLSVESTTGYRPACKLRLRQDSQNQDLSFFEPMDTISAAAAASPGVSSRFFLDPKGRQTGELQDWLCLAEDLHRVGQPILPLFINGQVKNGKSFLLNEALPAVANTYYSSGGSGRQHAGAVLSEPNFLRVNCLGCERTSGSGDFLMAFLLKLKRSAADQQLSAAASTPVPSIRSAGAMADAIQDYMRRLPRDRLNFLLIDEAQSFYLMTRPVSKDSPLRGSALDVDAVLDMRRILKELLLDSPHWVAWAVTGSSMATLWANIAATPTNGFPLIMHHRRLNLSPTVSMGVVHDAWEQLKAWDPALPDDLVWRSPPQIATLAYLCQEWRYSRTASTAAELVENTMTQKLIPEVLADLRTVLQVLGQPAAQLLLLRELLDPISGVEPDKLPLAFKVQLASFATERDGRLYLDYPLLAQALQAITTESGELLDSITAVQSISSKIFRELVVLGECCKDSKHFDRYKDLHSLLEDMASALALTPDGLLKADWFIQVLDHRCNSHGGKANFEQDYGAQARQDVKVGLRWFHALLRNVLSHGSLLEQRQALQVYPSKLAEFHSSGRISEVVTKTYSSPTPRRSKAPGALVAAAPRAQLQPHAGPVRPMSLHLGKRLGRAAVVQPRYMGRM